MKLWHIWQTVNTGYDTYDSAVVAAETEEDARKTHPSDYVWRENNWYYYSEVSDTYYAGDCYTWSAPKDIQVECIGEANEGTEAGVIVASFNAG